MASDPVLRKSEETQGVLQDFKCSGTTAILERSSLHGYHTLVWVKMWATYGHSLITVTWSSLVDVAVTTRDVGLRQQVSDEIQASELFEKLSK